MWFLKRILFAVVSALLTHHQIKALRLLPYYHNPESLVIARSGFGRMADVVFPRGAATNVRTDGLSSYVDDRFELKKAARPYGRPYGKRASLPVTSLLESSLADSGALECLANDDTIARAVCPGIDRKGRYRCIDAGMLCDGRRHCPHGEDENELMCMFHKLTLHYIGTYGQTITKWLLPLRP